MRRLILFLLFTLGMLACDSKPATNTSVAPTAPIVPVTAPIVPVAATTQSPVDSHEGKEFYGWECKNLEPLQSNKEVAVELTGPVMVHRQEHMAVVVWLHDPVVMAWRRELHRSRVLAGPDKGKFMEDFWESHFTNGVKESLLELGKDVSCFRCADGYDGWRFSLSADVPDQDDPTQLHHLSFRGACEEKWLANGKASPVVQPKDWAQQ